MAGGTWTTQNKVRPGVYVNVVSEGKSVGTLGERGIVTFPLAMSWGPSKKVIEISAGDNVRDLLGYDITAPELLLVKEAMKRAHKILIYRLNTGVAAKGTVGSLTATARYSGSRGNDIKVVIQKNIDDDKKFDVITVFAGTPVYTETVHKIEELVGNAYVGFSGNGELEVTAGLPLTGGSNGTVTNQDHMDYLEAIEVHDFNAMALPNDEQSLKSVYTSFVKRLREKEGKKVQIVMPNYSAADYEGVISVKNGVVLSDGTILDEVKATAWVAAATAAAGVNESLTYTAYDDAVDVDKKYTNTKIEEALKNGELLFVQNNGRAVVEQDINTFIAYTPEKGRQFAKNRVIRVLDAIGNDIKSIFEKSYIGKVNNNDDGRNLFKNECISYLNSLQGASAIQNFDSQTDVVILPGDEVDAIYCELHIQPVDSVEKIYLKATLQ
ncbi:phage tail sheath protein [Paenibacillus sp. KS1]|uniref:phage tail sheath family protein n=1 Tax=Paenibacillus sp. KS1 TaxID=1849249 RepID=UPI00080654CF|nr:phage tail sheath family protein [Paenibacillus sp. KS1]OBY77200.1 phage tail sheath protein [Paenibacillus sp. KS1]